MKKLIIATAAILVFIGLGYLIYSNLMIQRSLEAAGFGPYRPIANNNAIVILI